MIPLTKIKNFDEAWPKECRNLNARNTVINECSNVQVGIDEEELAKTLFADEILVSGVILEDINYHWDLYDFKERFIEKAKFVIKYESRLLKIQPADKERK